MIALSVACDVGSCAPLLLEGWGSLCRARCNNDPLPIPPLKGEGTTTYRLGAI